MIDLLYLYRWTLLSAIVTAPALALIGAQILARGWATRALIVSQASSTGIIAGLALMSWLGAARPLTVYTGTVVSAVGLSVVIGLLLVLIDRFEMRGLHSSDPGLPALLFSIYVGLIAFGSILTALSPHLESSMTAAFAGDLSTATDLESRLSLAISLGLLGWLWLKWRELTHHAFTQTVLFAAHPRDRQWIFALVSMLALAISMQSMGLIFILGTLFVPVAAIGKRDSNLNRFKAELAFTASVGTAIGFILSLSFTFLPTTPMIILSQAVVGGVLRLIRRYRN